MSKIAVEIEIDSLMIIVSHRVTFGIHPRPRDRNITAFFPESVNKSLEVCPAKYPQLMTEIISWTIVMAFKFC